MKVSATLKPRWPEERVCGAPRSQLPLVLTCPDLVLINRPNMGTVISPSLSNGILWKLTCSPSDADCCNKDDCLEGVPRKVSPENECVHR